MIAEVERSLFVNGIYDRNFDETGKIFDYEVLIRHCQACNLKET